MVKKKKSEASISIFNPTVDKFEAILLPEKKSSQEIPALDTSEARRLFVHQIMYEVGAIPVPWGGGNQWQIEKLPPEASRKLLLLRRNQRNIIPGSMKTLRRAMTVPGLWKVNGAPITFDRDWYLSDFQHRLLAAVETGFTFPHVIALHCPDPGMKMTQDTGHTRKPKDLSGFSGVHLNGSHSAAILFELFNFGVVQRDLLTYELSDLATHNPLREVAVGVYNAGRKTKATCGAVAAAVRIVRVDGPSALMFLTPVFNNCAMVANVHSKAGQRLADYLIAQGGKSSRNARGSVGLAREAEIAERVFLEYLRWKKGDQNDNASPGRKKNGKLIPEYFQISDEKMASERQAILEKGIQVTREGI